jgi:hypothetical protein
MIKASHAAVAVIDCDFFSEWHNFEGFSMKSLSGGFLFKPMFSGSKMRSSNSSYTDNKDLQTHNSSSVT